jgi:hypothetical protein
MKKNLYLFCRTDDNSHLQLCCLVDMILGTGTASPVQSVKELYFVRVFDLKLPEVFCEKDLCVVAFGSFVCCL